MTVVRKMRGGYPAQNRQDFRSPGRAPRFNRQNPIVRRTVAMPEPRVPDRMRMPQPSIRPRPNNFIRYGIRPGLVGLVGGLIELSFDTGFRKFHLPGTWVWNNNQPAGIPSNFAFWAGSAFLTDRRFGGATNFISMQVPYSNTTGLVERRTYLWRNYVTQSGLVRGVAYNGAVEPSPYINPQTNPKGTVVPATWFVPRTDLGPLSPPAMDHFATTKPEVTFRDAGNDADLFARPRLRSRTNPVPSFVWRYEVSPGNSVVPSPGKAVSPSPGTVPSIRPPNAAARPPGRGEKEKKVRTRSVALGYAFIGAITEGLDFVQALHKALPDQYRRQYGDIAGKLSDLYNHWDQVNIEDAIVNIIVDNIEDMIWAFEGRASGAASARFGDETGRLTGFGQNGGLGAAAQDSPVAAWSPQQVLIDWLDLDPAVRAVLRTDRAAFTGWVVSHF